MKRQGNVPAWPRRRRPVPPPGREDCTLVLQGGGALGAYQAGAFEALVHAGRAPDWVAGISIGAINAALIAGNPPQRRVERLREFWHLVSSASLLPIAPAAAFPPRALVNGASAAQVLLFGVPGFFAPRFPPAMFQPRGTPAAISHYDTALLRQTLERLVDFDRINGGEMRLSVGAVNVRSGHFVYFDSAKQPLDARHVMASGALPPGFAPVEIDGEHYWDGGLVSNTPLQYVLDHPGARPRVVIQVDLFPAYGALPTTLAEVAAREKDIRFASRVQPAPSPRSDLQALTLAAQRLLTRLPARLRDDPDVKALARLQGDPAVDVLHLVYRGKPDETQAKDHEFSRLSMLEHWESGRADLLRALNDARWRNRGRSRTGLRVFDLTLHSPAAS